MPEIDKKQLESEIRAIVAEIIEVEPEELTLEAKFVEDLGMDSMQALEIMAAVEKKYKVQFPEDYLGKIANLSSLLVVAEKIIGNK